MAFKCESCRLHQPPGTKPIRVVSETRPRDYKDRDGIPYGSGWEIVREVNLCAPCAKLVTLDVLTAESQKLGLY